MCIRDRDINNTAIPLSLKDAMTGVYYPAVEEVRDKLAAFADEWRDVPMLARTHGQPASPTTLGKEFMVFVERVEKQLAMLHEMCIRDRRIALHEPHQAIYDRCQKIHCIFGLQPYKGRENYAYFN